MPSSSSASSTRNRCGRRRSCPKAAPGRESHARVRRLAEAAGGAASAGRPMPDRMLSVTLVNGMTDSTLAVVGGQPGCSMNPTSATAIRP